MDCSTDTGGQDTDTGGQDTDTGGQDTDTGGQDTIRNRPVMQNMGTSCSTCSVSWLAV